MRPRLGTRQGGPKSPSAWSHLLARVVSDLECKWKLEPPVVPWVDDSLLAQTGLFIWADNVFLVSGSWPVLRRRVLELEAAFGELDLRFSTSSLEVVCSPAAAALAREPILLADGRCLVEKQEMLALGVCLDSRASTEAMLRYRLECTRKMWGRLGGMLCNPRVPWRERARRLYSCLGACLLWGAGIWSLTQSVLDKVSAQEIRWLRRVSGFFRVSAAEESWAEWLSWTKRAVHKRRHREGLRSLAQRLCSAVFSWHGHLARRKRSELHVAGRWMEWRDQRWWQTRKALGDGFGEGRTWRHARHNWQKPSERALHDWNPEWKMLAQDREAWSRQRQKFEDWCRRRWRGPRAVEARVAAHEPTEKKKTIGSDRRRLRALQREFADRVQRPSKRRRRG